MANPIDIAIDYDAEKKYFDVSFENGQFKTVESFDTSLKMVVFCERRADESEVPSPEYRRGWWGNEILQRVAGAEIGSKLWLLRQSRRTPDTLQRAINYAKQGCEWLIEDGHVDDVQVTAENLGGTGIFLKIDLITFTNKVESRYFDLWNNTGAGG